MSFVLHILKEDDIVYRVCQYPHYTQTQTPDSRIEVQEIRATQFDFCTLTRGYQSNLYRGYVNFGGLPTAQDIVWHREYISSNTQSPPPVGTIEQQREAEIARRRDERNRTRRPWERFRDIFR